MADSTRNERADGGGMLAPEVVALLRCPVTGQRLALAERDGARVLRTEDAKREYPIVDGVPVLLASAAVPR